MKGTSDGLRAEYTHELIPINTHKRIVESIHELRVENTHELYIGITVYRIEY